MPRLRHCSLQCSPWKQTKSNCKRRCRIWRRNSLKTRGTTTLAHRVHTLNKKNTQCKPANIILHVLHMHGEKERRAVFRTGLTRNMLVSGKASDNIPKGQREMLHQHGSCRTRLGLKNGKEIGLQQIFFHFKLFSRTDLINKLKLTSLNSYGIFFKCIYF